MPTAIQAAAILAVRQSGPANNGNAHQPDNVPAVLAQLAERLDEQDARIEALTVLQADQAIRDKDRYKQPSVQVTALRATAAPLPRNIPDAGKAANVNGNGNDTLRANSLYGKMATGNRNNNSNSNGGGNPGHVVGAGLGGEANLGPLEARTEVGGRIGTRQNPSQWPQAAEPQTNPDGRKGGGRIDGSDKA